MSAYKFSFLILIPPGFYIVPPTKHVKSMFGHSHADVNDDGMEFGFQDPGSGDHFYD